MPPLRRASLTRVATIDGDATDITVYGRTRQNSAHAHTEVLSLQALKALPAGVEHIRCRWDAGYSGADLACA